MATGHGPQIAVRLVGANSFSPSTACTTSATDVLRDRDWWLGEVRRIGSDWPGILRLHFAVLVCCLPEILQACETCGTSPCINPGFCAECRQADARLRSQRRRRLK